MLILTQKTLHANGFNYWGEVSGEAIRHEKQLKKHIVRLAEAIGIVPNRVYDQKSGVVNSKKLGGTLLEGYFHHAGQKLSLGVSQQGEEIDNWKPKDGWPTKDTAMIADHALISNPKGGIDLSSDKAMQVRRNVSIGTKFDIDFAMIQQYQSVSGFVPVIIKMMTIAQLLASDKNS